MSEQSVATSVRDVEIRLGELVQASSLCLHKRLPRAALCLLYVAIDNAASIDQRLQHLKDPSGPFTGWVDRYILPTGKLECSALDLYGARCGLVHDCSPASRHSRRGKAKEIWYAYHEANVGTVRERAEEANRTDVVGMSLDKLTSAVTRGMTAFIADLQSDRTLAAWALEHLEDTFEVTETISGATRRVPSWEDLTALAESLSGRTRRAGGAAVSSCGTISRG